MSWTRKTRGSCIAAKRLADFLGERGDLLGGGALGREPGGADLEDAARLVHLVAREAVERGEETQRIGVERRRAVGNVGARAVPRSHDAHGRERPQPGANRRPADANLRGEIAFGRQAIAGLERAALDELADVGHDLSGPAFGTLAGPRRAGRQLPARRSGSDGARGHGVADPARGLSASGDTSADSNARCWPEYRLGIGRDRSRARYLVRVPNVSRHQEVLPLGIPHCQHRPDNRLILRAV